MYLIEKILLDMGFRKKCGATNSITYEYCDSRDTPTLEVVLFTIKHKSRAWEIRAKYPHLICATNNYPVSLNHINLIESYVNQINDLRQKLLMVENPWQQVYIFNSWSALAEFGRTQAQDCEIGDMVILEQGILLKTDIPTDRVWVCKGPDRHGVVLFDAKHISKEEGSTYYDVDGL